MGGTASARPAMKYLPTLMSRNSGESAGVCAGNPGRKGRVPDETPSCAPDPPRPTAARWPARRVRGGIAGEPRRDTSLGHRPASVAEQLYLNFTAAGPAQRRGLSRPWRAEQHSVVISGTCSKTPLREGVSPASATFRSATMILSGHYRRLRAFTAKAFEAEVVPASAIST